MEMEAKEVKVVMSVPPDITIRRKGIEVDLFEIHGKSPHCANVVTNAIMNFAADQYIINLIAL